MGLVTGEREPDFKSEDWNQGQSRSHTYQSGDLRSHQLLYFITLFLFIHLLTDRLIKDGKTNST